MENLARICAIKNSDFVSSCNRKILLVVRIRVNELEIFTVSGMGYFARIVFLKLNTWQQYEVIEEVVMNKGETVCVDFIIVLLKFIGVNGV